MWHVWGIRCEDYMNLKVARENSYKKSIHSRKNIFLIYFLCGTLPTQYRGLLGERFQVHIL